MSDVPTNHQVPLVDGSGRYEIRVRGHLAARWVALFDGMSLTHQGDGTTVLSGAVGDQAALHGLLRKLTDVGLPLVSVLPGGTGEAQAGCASDPTTPTRAQTRPDERTTR